MKKRWLLVPAALTLSSLGVLAQSSVAVPRQKVQLTCSDDYFKTERQNFLLLDETYNKCTLALPLALKQRWSGPRTFYFLPRLSVALAADDGATQNPKTRWITLSSFGNPAPDVLHRAVRSRDYQTADFYTGLEKPLKEWAGNLTPKVLGVNGRVTVCAAPVYKGEDPCVTYDVNARFSVYKR
jgi:hypothetical protein